MNYNKDDVMRLMRRVLDYDTLEVGQTVKDHLGNKWIVVGYEVDGEAGMIDVVMACEDKAAHIEVNRLENGKLDASANVGARAGV